MLDVYKGIKNVQKKQIEIEIHDTSGDEHLGVNRKVQYKDADVFMICVAANSHESLESVARWKSEIQEIEQEKPVALILTKSLFTRYVVRIDVGGFVATSKQFQWCVIKTDVSFEKLDWSIEVNCFVELHDN